MFLPRILRPIPAASIPDVRIQRISEAPFSVLTGPAGTHVVERLAGTIAGWNRWHGCVWLRAVSSRPDTLARELADACRHRWGSDDGDTERDAMSLLRDVLCRSPAEAVVVLEVDTRAVRGVRRLVADLRPGLVDRRTSVVAIAETTPGSWWRSTGPGAGLSDHQLGETGPLPELCRDRLWHVAGRRPAVLHDVLAAAQSWGVDAVSAAVGAVWTLRSLLDDLTGELLDRCDAGELSALRTCVSTGYWHPQLTTPAVSPARLRPWVVPLEESWCWLRPIWKDPLRRQLTGRDGLGAPASRSRCAGAIRPGPPAGDHHGLLQARLFGELDVRVDGRIVARWYGKRGRSVLRFLLARRQRACGRDELLATFWPDVPPEIGRNRLQVAVSGLRKAFGAITGVNVVEYGDGSYRISRALRVEVDVDRFESAVAAAKQADRAGDGAASVAAYRDAAAYYRGDFAADAPSEHWTLIPRENLRITYLDALARIGRVELSGGAHDECIVTARRMLEVDPCCEDAHQLLMWCYDRQGRTYEAHRQYEFCRRVLRSVLDVEPASATTRLHDAIRAGSAPEPALIGRRAPGR